jgi:para-nitrobenzyl esterase
MTTASAASAQTSFGKITGVVEDGVCVFRGVPYAAPPVGALRFAPPQPPQPWTGSRDAGRDGPVPPQPPSRLRAAMGDFEAPQDEDCLSLTISTPAADGRRRPVLLWLHGGAFWTGAGSLPWYSGNSLARHGDVVVVGVNYRLGALGFMSLPGVSPPNLGLLDQFAALRWVSKEIAAFGGDPDNITLVGQSAGGLSILAMLAQPEARGRFRRAIIQSAPFGRMLRPLDAASRIGESVGRALGITDPSQWHTVSAQQINVAQLVAARELAGFASTTPPFIPVSDHQLLGDDVVGAALAGALEKDLMIGYTRDESAAFFAMDEKIAQATDEQIRQVFARLFGAAAEPAMAEYRERARLPGPAGLLGELMGDASFGSGLFDFAARLNDLGRPAHVFRFDWMAPDNRFGACHCIELPFMFDTLPAWNAPMLAGGDPQDMRALADTMRDAWIAFARSGNPVHPGLPSWPRHGDGLETLLFDRQCRVAADPAGRRRWKYWP